jgi:hypothetical protein
VRAVQDQVHLADYILERLPLEERERLGRMLQNARGFARPARIPAPAQRLPEPSVRIFDGEAESTVLWGLDCG